MPGVALRTLLPWHGDHGLKSQVTSALFAFALLIQRIGETLVVAEVRYCQVVGQGEKIVDFQDSIEILTCNAVDNVSVRFKGAPTGSEVQVSVTP